MRLFLRSFEGVYKQQNLKANELQNHHERKVEGIRELEKSKLQSQAPVREQGQNHFTLSTVCSLK